MSTAVDGCNRNLTLFTSTTSGLINRQNQAPSLHTPVAPAIRLQTGSKATGKKG